MSVPQIAEQASRPSCPPPPRQDEPDLPLFEFTTRLVSTVDEAAELVPAWNRLANVAIEPNVFHESWSLLPAWRHLPQGERPELLVVEAPKRVFPQGPKVLCGLFPIVRRRSFYGLPIRTWELWRHMHCFLGTPLVRRDCARETLDAFFRAAAQGFDGSSKASVVHLPLLAADGPLQRILVESNDDAGRSVFTKDLSTRALFRADVDAESFLKASLSRKKRQGIQRTERRLAEHGALATEWFADGDDLSAWIDEFLRLEAGGWKGERQTALGSESRQADFFREMAVGAAARNQLMLGRLTFAGRPIAMICNLLSRDGGYSFKIAYDESFAEHSPGLLLELALIRELHERGIAWMDSCAASDHSMINHLWPARTIRQSLVVSTGARGGDLAVALMPLVRWLKNKVARRGAKTSIATA